MNENIEIQENNNLNNNKSKGPIIIIILLLIALLGTIGYILYDKGIIFSNKNNTEVKQEEKKEETKKEENNTNNEVVKYEDQSGKLNVTKNNDSVAITINGKKYELSYQFVQKDSEFNVGDVTIKLGDKKIFEDSNAFLEYDGNYQIVTLNDNKQYLIYNIVDSSNVNHHSIIDENGNKIIEISGSDKEEKPASDGKKYTVVYDDQFKIDNGYIYYYNCKKITSVSNSKAIADEIKVTINNGKATEEKTGNEKEISVMFT